MNGSDPTIASPSSESPRLLQRASGILLHKRLPLMLAVLATLLTLPALWVGIEADDYPHRLMLLDLPLLGGVNVAPWDIFAFANGNPERNQRLMDIGIAPWWTLTEVRMAFFRPITAITQWLDYKLWPDNFVLMHVHSLLWFFLVVIAATSYYRRIMGWTVAAGLAALLFAVDDCHATPAGWLAGRNAVTAMLFGLLALIAHDRWRRNRWRPGIVAGPLALALALLSAEAGLATMAYLVPYAVFVDRGKWRDRLLALTPCVVIVIIWRVVWAAMGYGVHGVEAYADPISQPGRFLLGVAEIGPVLLTGQWASPPSDMYVFYDAFLPGLRLAVWAFSLVVVVLISAIMIPLLRRDALARFWAAGMLLSLLPVCASTNFPMDRLLMFVSLGAMGLLGMFLVAVFERWYESRRVVRSFLTTRRARFAAILLVVIHLVVGTVSLPIRAALPAGPEDFTGQLYVTLPPDEPLEGKTVVAVNAPAAGLVGLMPVIRAVTDQTVPEHTRVLGPSLSAMNVTRTAPDTLVITPATGWLDWAYDGIVRSSDFPLATGQRIELAGMTVEILALAEDHRPAKASFTFDVPLDDPTLIWLQWREGGFVPFTPPPIGETIELPATIPML